MKTMVVVSGGFVSGQPEHAGQLEPGHHHGARTPSSLALGALGVGLIAIRTFKRRK